MSRCQYRAPKRLSFERLDSLGMGVGFLSNKTAMDDCMESPSV